ncbi:MAG TPA: FTR1 family protein [Rhodanobacteraceae bacterium]|nr:FTR1 family protein [Rhodanobacteraceae bacterium]
MITTRIRIYAFLVLLAVPATIWAAQKPDTSSRVQRIWQMLDYVATDYAGAVRDGAVVSASEFAEMREFTTTIGRSMRQLPSTRTLPDLQHQADALIVAVKSGKPAKDVSDKAHALAAALLEAYPVPSAPRQVPNPALGASLYRQHCAMCHGVRGDGHGAVAVHMNPPPIDFLDTKRADQRSLWSLYQVITQGVEGTAMRSYGETLSDSERWALAYYAGSLAYAESNVRGSQAWQHNPAIRARISNLGELSRTRVAQLAPVFGLPTAQAVMGWLRAHPDAVERAPHGLDLARARLTASIKAYRDGREADAVELALSAYLDGVEPEEPRLDARDHALRSQIETAMGAYRTALSRGQSVAAATVRAEHADQLLVRAQMLLDNTASSAATTFMGAFVILIREGMEALLVVVALLAFVRRSDRPEAARPVHAGWMLALLAGFATWGLARHAITISGAGRELTEGLSSLLAAAVLLGVGLWMHQKSIGGRWQHYLKRKMASALDRRSLWFLFGLSFISVYREIFETILFYVALWNENQEFWLLGGMIAGALTLAATAWLLLHTSHRLPLGQFFKASSALIALLAVVLAGKGVAALQEAGWINVSVIPAPRIEWLGVYPTWQSLGMQLAVIAVLATGFMFNAVRGRKPA